MLPKSELAILWAMVLVILCHANPINRQAGGQNTLRLDVRNQSYTEQNVCVNDDVLYQPGDQMPAPNPCSRCICNPPGSQCTPVACEKKPGCKALLRPNQCCPEYQCECERNGRIYQNGERLDNADNPCEACYCQGGEVVCTTVECYKRDDCEPQYVEGKCCPKYDHCPPLVMDDARFSDQSAAEKARPHHTRSTFQPDAVAGTVGADTIDQALDASNVQERVHVPDTTVTADTTEYITTPTSTSAVDPTKEHVHEPAFDHHFKGEQATDVPAPTVHEDAVVPTIKIEVPAIPWTESPKQHADKSQNHREFETEHDGSGDDAETQTAASNDDQGSGVQESELPLIKSQDEGLIGVIEHITEAVQQNTEAGEGSTDKTSIEETPDVQKSSVDKLLNDEDNKEEPVEATTSELALEVTEVTEVEADPTTLSSEFTDVPEEMITTAEPVSDTKDVTEAAGVDFPTETLLEATATAKDTTLTVESSTDSNPELKDFDEWSGTKSSEIQRDSSSIGSSSSSSSSDSHSKHSLSSSDESTSHFLPTNVYSEKVKPSTGDNADNTAGSSYHHSSTLPTDSEESDSTEGSATTEISDSDNSDSFQKVSGHKQEILSSQKSDSDGDMSVDKRTSLSTESKSSQSLSQIEEKGKIEEKPVSNGQINIVLDTEATDENGPPILLIGDDLANHQMDIVVATVPTYAPEIATNIPSKDKPELRTAEKGTSNEKKPLPDSSEETTTVQQISVTIGVHSSNSENAPTEKDANEEQTEAPVSNTTPNDDIQITETISITTISENKDLTSTTKKNKLKIAHDEIMLSDDPLPGQVPSTDFANEDSIDKILGKTDEEIKKEQELQKLDEIKEDSQESPVLTTLSVGVTTELPSAEVKTAEVQTELPVLETTTNIVPKVDVGTTENSPIEMTTNNNADGKTKGDEQITDINIADRRSDISNDPTTEVVTGNPTTNSYFEIESTVAYDDKERNKADSNVRSKTDDNQSAVNEETTERKDTVQNNVFQGLNKSTDTDQPTNYQPDDVTATVSSEDVTTTQNPVTNKADKVKDFAHEEMLLGDQPLTSHSSPYFHLQKEKEEEVIKQEEGKNEDVEEKTEMNLESAIIHEEIHYSESDQESGVNKENERETEEKSESDSAHGTENNYFENSVAQIKKGTDATNENIPQTQVETDVIANQENLEQNSEKYDESTQILVETTQTPENIPLKSESEEKFTPPPDVTIADANEAVEATTNSPEVVVKSMGEKEQSIQVTENESDTTTLESVITEQTLMTDRHQDTTDNVPKINPDILELKPIVSSPASNTTEVLQEGDVTTLPPQWLKNENKTKEDDSRQKENKEDKAPPVTEIDAMSDTTVEPTERAEDSSHDVPAATTVQTLTLGEVVQQRLDDKKGVEEADKKDLFILEDFFTKLYRHQIATDATKH